MVSPTTPHTPRSRLTLDLSELPVSTSNNSSPPVSPSSYSTYSALPSPTLSGSWSQTRSQAELTALLKDAYIRIREKERDLTLAAEIGKSLLDNNNDLKAKYEALMDQFEEFQKQRQQNSKFTIQAADKTNVTRLAPPNGSLETFEEEPSDYEDDESDNESAAGFGASLHPIARSRSPSRVPMYKDYEDYRELEMKNAELQAKVDSLISEVQESDRLHKAKQRKLEAELTALQDTYQSATQKIEDLQKENERLLQRLRNSFWESRKEKNSENENVIEELAQKIQELDIQNAGIERAKAEIERRLQRTLQDLEAFRSQCNTLEDKTRDFSNLQLAYHKQTELVNQLSVSLEEQRMINMGLRRSRAGSFSDSGFMHRLSDAADNSALARPLTSKRSLLEEFESEWISNIKRDMNWGDESPQFSPVASEGDLREFLLKNGVQPDFDDDVSAIDYMSEDEFTFLEEFDEDDEIAMRRREWFWKRWIRAVYRFFRWIWRWIEFLFLLGAAVVLALYRGPDHLLPGDL
ncbi:11167_t:CDS:2 [Paraglomus brasilianum]|uniref:11167_t:CDS:1 n=1 Tax=Paraglomus brasilianum TaxID=144538 RepID=A0A9N8Z0U4_9GLOM|nr:11167_t:CDS:2 [Paraglomus brasilianum]